MDIRHLPGDEMARKLAKAFLRKLMLGIKSSFSVAAKGLSTALI